MDVMDLHASKFTVLYLYFSHSSLAHSGNDAQFRGFGITVLSIDGTVIRTL